jgi:uncharacterized phage infection (PIP) family protein YhgE
MSALKEYLERCESLKAFAKEGGYPCLPYAGYAEVKEISDRLDALERQAKPQAERGCDPYVELAKAAIGLVNSVEAGCGDCRKQKGCMIFNNSITALPCSSFEPKQAQEHGGDDKFFNSDMQNGMLIDELRKKLREAEERASGISELSENLEFERDDLCARLAVANADLAMKEHAKQELQKENANLQEWNKAAKESVALASAEVSRLTAEVSEFKKQATSALDEAKKKMQSVYDLSTKQLVAEMQNMHDCAIEALQSENAELKRTCEVLEAGQCVAPGGCAFNPKDKSEVKP